MQKDVEEGDSRILAQKIKEEMDLCCLTITSGEIGESIGSTREEFVSAEGKIKGARSDIKDKIVIG